MKQRLVIYTEAVGSGLGRYAVELANALSEVLARNAVDVCFIGPSQDHTLRVSEIETLETSGGGSRLAKLVSLAEVALAGARRVRARCGPTAPLLMVHLAPTLPVSLAPLLAAKLAGAKTALSLHDFYPHTLRFPRALQGVERAIYRLAYRHFDLILTNTNAQAERLAIDARVPAARIVPLYHGVFLVPHITPPLEGSPTTLLVFGSLRPNKQVLETIGAVTALRAKGLDVRLRIAGAPRREDVEYWRRCQEILPTDDPAFDVRDRFIEEAELGEIFSGIDAFICPYLGFDSQSGVAITAASNGIPLIGTAVAAPAGVKDQSAAWTEVDPVADRTATAAAICVFLDKPRALRVSAAAALAESMRIDTGWGKLAESIVTAMNSTGFYNRHE